MSTKIIDVNTVNKSEGYTLALDAQQIDAAVFRANELPPHTEDQAGAVLTNTGTGGLVYKKIEPESLVVTIIDGGEGVI